MSQAGRRAPDDLPVREAVERWLRRQRLDKSDSTVATYRRRLGHFVAWAEDESIQSVGELTPWLLDEFDTHRRGQGVRAISLKNELMTLRLFVEYLERLGLVAEGLSEAVDPPSVASGEETSDEFLAPDRAEALLDAYADGDDQYTREHAFIALAWWTGARMGAIRGLDLADVNTDEGYVHFRHRPEQETPLKNGTDGERIVGISASVVDALQGWIRERRPTVTDGYGRRPLFASSRGRCHLNTLRGSCYFGTVPCRHGPCPHGNERPDCEHYSRSKAHGCPSSVSPHPIRSGSIMWQLNRGIRADRVADRVDATPETIDTYYDKVTQLDEFRKRRAGELDKLGFEDDEEDDIS